MLLGPRLMKGLVTGSAEVQQKKFSWRRVLVEESEKEMRLPSASGCLPQHPEVGNYFLLKRSMKQHVTVLGVKPSDQDGQNHIC